MRVSVDLPDPKTQGLDAALAKQFADIQRQLLGWMQEQDASKHTMMEGMATQQERLVTAMERLMQLVAKRPPAASSSDALLSAMRGLKQVMADLPDDLKNTLAKSSGNGTTRAVRVSVSPHLTVKMPPQLMKRMDAMETALVRGLKKSRNRTFGSNF